MTSNGDALSTIENSTPALTITMAENDAEKTVIGHGNNDAVSASTFTSQDHGQRDSTRNHDTSQDDLGITNPTTLTISYPQVDFPFTFYSFIQKVSVSHPHIVAWSECGEYFKIDRHAKELPALIGQHFQRKCLYTSASQVFFLCMCVRHQ
jgi:hypothetical protein